MIHCVARHGTQPRLGILGDCHVEASQRLRVVRVKQALQVKVLCLILTAGEVHREVKALVQCISQDMLIGKPGSDHRWHAGVKLNDEMLAKVVFVLHGVCALAVAAVVLLAPELVKTGLTLANRLLGSADASFTNAEPFLLMLFGSTMLAMGLFDLLALASGSRELKRARCIIGACFNGGNALLALWLARTAPAGACPGYVLSIIPSDGLFGVLYLIAFFTLGNNVKPKSKPKRK
eukprot:TRINITY_DN2530_c0_g1_i1.p1 TRINITY_DN2530_c0_g1~~TRINITY_DN2530_c0_g1_i1.p1  ORF type:complete len:235 (+),score=68.12 TRINITY_DN2530_c0_g1_i1:641-1345(+)